METGPLVYGPSMAEEASWRLMRMAAGAVLMGISVLGMAIGVAGILRGEAEGGSTLTMLLTAFVSLAIAVFGLRYIALGLKGSPARIYERGVEADFFGRSLVWPERQTVPLVRIDIGGSARHTRATAVTSTGHAFSLPSSFVDEADLWYLGSMGSTPIAPGGREAKTRYERGELEPPGVEEPPEPPYHGPPWPEKPPLPREAPASAVEVVETAPEVDVRRPPEPRPAMPAPHPPHPAEGHAPLTSMPERPPEGPAPPSATQPTELPGPPEPPRQSGVLEELPEAPMMGRAAPSPVPRPPPSVPSPTRPSPEPTPEVEVGGWEEEWELEEIEAPPQLEPGKEGRAEPDKKRSAPASGWEWEEL